MRPFLHPVAGDTVNAKLAPKGARGGDSLGSVELAEYAFAPFLPRFKGGIFRRFFLLGCLFARHQLEPSSDCQLVHLHYALAAHAEPAPWGVTNNITRTRCESRSPRFRLHSNRHWWG